MNPCASVALSAGNPLKKSKAGSQALVSRLQLHCLSPLMKLAASRSCALEELLSLGIEKWVNSPSGKSKKLGIPRDELLEDDHVLSQNTGLGKSKFTVVSQNRFILVLLLLFHMNNCKPTFAPRCIFWYQSQKKKNGQCGPWQVWLSWLEHHSVNCNVAGSIPGQGTYLGCGFGPQAGCMQECSRPMFLSHISVSLPFSFPPFPSLRSQ